MKVQKIRFNYSIVSYGLLAIGLLAGCAKVQTTRVDTISNLTTQSTIAGDEQTINDEFDQFADDAITALCRPDTTIYDAYVDSVSRSFILITYGKKNWETDSTKSRIGCDSIHINAGAAWGNPTASANISLGDVQNNPEYEITYRNNATNIRFTGTATITYLSGKLLQKLTAGDSLEVQIRATVSFTYNENAGSSAQFFTWNLNQVRTFTLSGATLNATTRGDTEMNGSSNACTWGTTRTGGSFYSFITSKVVQNISDPYLSYNPISGAKTTAGITESIVSTYGVNSQGSVITSGTPYGFLITWYNGGNASAVIPYYY